MLSAVACAELSLDDEATRLEQAAGDQGFQHAGMDAWLHPLPAHLALLRGDLARVDALLESSGATWHLSTDCNLHALATKLEALIALGRTEEAEQVAIPLLQPGTHLEPFAMRTLGVTRGDRSLTERAVDRFEAMGLGWHAAWTRARYGAAQD